MVVSREAHATDAGIAVLRAGGNAVDSAVAVGFAMTVTHPSAGNIGGGGFMLVRFAGGRATFIEFSGGGSGERLGADLAMRIFVTFCAVAMFSGGLNEESGWRGFAQQRLQRRYSPLVTALQLWAFMVVWHIPNDIIQYRDGGYQQERIGLYPFITVLFSWVYNRTRGSIPAVAIFHASMNSMNPLMGILPITQAGNLLLMGFAVAVAVLDPMWRRLPEDHPAVHPEAHLSVTGGA